MMPKEDALTFFRGAPRRWGELHRAAESSGVTAAPTAVAARRAEADTVASGAAERLAQWRRPGEGGDDPYATMAAEIDHIPGDIWPERGGPASAAVDRIAALLRQARDELEQLGVPVEA